MLISQDNEREKIVKKKFYQHCSTYRYRRTIWKYPYLVLWWKLKSVIMLHGLSSFKFSFHLFYLFQTRIITWVKDSHKINTGAQGLHKLVIISWCHFHLFLLFKYWSCFRHNYKPIINLYIFVCYYPCKAISASGKSDEQLINELMQYCWDRYTTDACTFTKINTIICASHATAQPGRYGLHVCC